MSSRRRDQALIVLVMALAAWLRLRGITFGLPAVYNPDEVAIMSRALAFASGDLNPHNFLYPTLYFYLLFGWIGMYFVGCMDGGRDPVAGGISTVVLPQSFRDLRRRPCAVGAVRRRKRLWRRGASARGYGVRPPGWRRHSSSPSRRLPSATRTT